MKKLTLRTLSFLLIVGMLVSVFPMTVFAAQKNTGTRHELCTSLSSQAAAYYTGDYSPDALVGYETDTTGSCLKAVDSELYNVLQTLMAETHTYFVKYKGSNGLQDYWPDTDCSKEISKPILFYSDGTGGFNREHVWPKSRASFYQSEGGSDLHHLRPTNEGMNTARSNYAFTNVREYMEKPEEVKLDGKVVLWLNKTYAENTPEEQKTSDNLGMVEVNDNIKGDVARILLYVYTRWEERNLFENDPNAQPGSPTDENNGLRVFFDRETMLQWCEMDPVDTWEMSRNDATQAVQGNRNVFIDYPELAWLLFGEVPPADMNVPEKLPLNQNTYAITASSNNTAWGTVKQSGRRIIAVPNEGYFAEDYTILSGSAQVVRDGNIFTVTAESDCSIRINFAPRKAVTATFNAGVESITAYAGDEITLPTASAPQDHRFIGWVTETIEDTTTKPSFYEAGSKYTLAADVRFYALFAWSDGDSFGEWTLIKDSAELRSGMELVLASADNKAVAAPLNGKYFAKEAAKFSQDGNAIEELPESAVILTLGGQTNAWTLTGEDGKLLGVLGNKNIGWDDGSKEWKITVNNGNAVMYSANESYGRILYNVSSPRFTTYTNAVSNTLVLPQLYTNGGGKLHYTTDPTKCQHTDVLFHEAVEATCTENGTVAYYSCKDCGRAYAEEACTTELTDAELVVKALGHAWDEGTVTLAPTATEPGVKTFCCTRCGEVATESIPATGEEDPGTDPEDPNCEYGEDCGALIFTDMPAIDNWAHKGIDFVVKEGLFNGVANDIFAPNKTMTRAMLVTVLWRCAGEPEAEPAEFSDVATDKWYSKAVAWAAAEGVVNGLGDGTFRPDNQITREQLATILFRYVKLTEMDPAERADLNAFPDAEKVQPYAQEAFQWAVAKGLVNGVKNTSDNQTYLMPAGSATRAQVATILMRFLEN